jgi:predicted metal-dependent hydrolase
VTRSPAEALDLAEALIQDGRPFAAHEVLEGPWKQAPEAERDFWQGLAQITVGLTHAQRGNATGAAALLQRGCERLEPYAGTSPYDVNVDEVRRITRELAHRIERDGLPVPPTIRFKSS